MKCKIEGCSNESSSRGMCGAHYQRWRREGGKDEPKLKAPNGSGGLTHEGYVLLQVDGRRVYEHRYLAEKALGKPLPKGARIHHMGERCDNHGFGKLVICPDEEYHQLLHRRMEELNYKV
jgi:hypothetical protein